MNSKRCNFHEWPGCIPQVSCKFLRFSISDNDSTCKRQVSVKPSSPETATVCGDVNLLAASLDSLASRSNLQARTISVATHNLEMIDWQSAAFTSCKEGAKSSLITCEIVRLSCLKVPVASLLKLGEAVVC